MAVNVSIRLTDGQLAQLDRVVAAHRRRYRGVKFSRSDAVRLLLAQLDDLVGDESPDGART